MMKSNMEKKIAVQIDFDGTVTTEDVSFLLLDTFVGPAWRKHLEDYSSGDITVGAFNQKSLRLGESQPEYYARFRLEQSACKNPPRL